MSFNGNLILRDDVGVFCKTREQAIELLTYAKKRGLRWSTGRDFFEDFRFFDNLSTVYYLKRGLISAKEFGQSELNLILDFNQAKEDYCFKFDMEKILNRKTFIHCNSKTKAEILLKFFREQNNHIFNIELESWDYHKEKTIYSFYNMFGPIDKTGPIIPTLFFEQVLLNENVEIERKAILKQQKLKIRTIDI